MSAKGKSIKDLSARLIERGAEVLGPTNPYEVLRFRTLYGVGVIYKGKRGETWNAEAISARDHLDREAGSLAPVKVNGRRKDKATVTAILSRDRDECFFCGAPLDGDITVEHLVSIAHGGPNHISNLFLAHGDCNRKAGHLSAPEKIRLRDMLRRQPNTPSSSSLHTPVEDRGRDGLVSVKSEHRLSGERPRHARADHAAGSRSSDGSDAISATDASPASSSSPAGAVRGAASANRDDVA